MSEASVRQVARADRLLLDGRVKNTRRARLAAQACGSPRDIRRARTLTPGQSGRISPREAVSRIVDPSCAACRRPLTGKRSDARFCDATCRKRGSRRPETPVAAETPDSGGLLDALRRELDDAGRLETALGQQAIALAVKLASPHDTGSAMAAVSRELRAVREEALRGAEQAADPLDELRLRRDAKRAG